MQTYPLQNTGVSRLIQDFLNESPGLKNFYTQKVSRESLMQQAKVKTKSYKNRAVLTQVLSAQNQILTAKQQKNLKALENPNAVTVTTGHQLNLATGPLYFIYKILHTVKMCEEMNRSQEQFTFVPIFWMATEDHDFEEINHFSTYQSTYRWQRESGGFVGEMGTDGVLAVFTEFFKGLEKNQAAKNLEKMITKAYQKKDLAASTRFLVQELLGEWGVLILDANHPELKRLAIPYFEKELRNQLAQEAVQATNHQLSKYKEQAFAREINLFYSENGKRERIDFEDGVYFLVDSLKKFEGDEIFKALENSPEKFSPNVILRPLYQEIILPNVCYIGGGGEISYWLQLKRMFAQFEIEFPLIMLRNSFLILTKNQCEKATKFGILPQHLFSSISELKSEWVKQQTDLFEVLENLKESIEQKFFKASEIAEKTDDTFRQMLLAQQKKQLNGYEKMKKRLQKAEEKRLRSKIRRLENLYEIMFPSGTWQERKINFSVFYQKYGENFFEAVYESLDAFESNFVVKCFDY